MISVICSNISDHRVSELPNMKLTNMVPIFHKNYRKRPYVRDNYIHNVENIRLIDTWQCTSHLNSYLLISTKERNPRSNLDWNNDPDFLLKILLLL